MYLPANAGFNFSPFTPALWATGYVNFKTGGGIFFSQIIAPRVSTSAKTSENIPQVILGSLKVGIWAP